HAPAGVSRAGVASLQPTPRLAALPKRHLRDGLRQRRPFLGRCVWLTAVHEPVPPELAWIQPPAGGHRLPSLDDPCRPTPSGQRCSRSTARAPPPPGRHLRRGARGVVVRSLASLEPGERLRRRSVAITGRPWPG